MTEFPKEPHSEKPTPPQTTKADRWHHLRMHTSARIALGRAGGSLPTREWLDFKQAHAAARDAVHEEFDAAAMGVAIAEAKLTGYPGTLVLQSAVANRAEYLKRPDLGRRLSDGSREYLLKNHRQSKACDLAIVVSDGLSATATQRQAIPLLAALLPKLHAAGWQLSPITVVPFGRVAIEDDIGETYGTKLALILLGERPGLGSPDSLGAYLVYNPQRGRIDAERNCVSNIRPAGLPPAAAAETLFYLLTRSREQKLSGVQLKDDRPLNLPNSPQNLLQ